MKTYDDLTKEDKDKTHAFLGAISVFNQHLIHDSITTLAFLMVITIMSLSITTMGFCIIDVSINVAKFMIVYGIIILAFGLVISLVFVLLRLIKKEKLSKELYLAFGMESARDDIFQITDEDLKTLKRGWKKKVSK